MDSYHTHKEQIKVPILGNNKLLITWTILFVAIASISYSQNDEVFSILDKDTFYIFELDSVVIYPEDKFSYNSKEDSDTCIISVSWIYKEANVYGTLDTLDDSSVKKLVNFSNSFKQNKNSIEINYYDYAVDILRVSKWFFIRRASRIKNILTSNGISEENIIKFNVYSKDRVFDDEYNALRSKYGKVNQASIKFIIYPQF